MHTVPETQKHRKKLAIAMTNKYDKQNYKALIWSPSTTSGHETEASGPTRKARSPKTHLRGLCATTGENPWRFFCGWRRCWWCGNVVQRSRTCSVYWLKSGGRLVR